MIYSIVAFGDPILKTRAKDIPQDFPADELKQIVQDMFDTMYHAHGVGLAAPQVAKSIRLFVIDSEPMIDTEDEEKGGRVAPGFGRAKIRRPVRTG